jgi:hypothetical protein
MRRTINGAALIFFIWLLLDAFHIPDILLNFLLAGELPVFKTELSPTAMFAILTTTVVIILFETLSRRFSTLRRLRQAVISFMTSRTPRPLNRV